MNYSLAVVDHHVFQAMMIKKIFGLFFDWTEACCDVDWIHPRMNLGLAELRSIADPASSSYVHHHRPNPWTAAAAVARQLDKLLVDSFEPSHQLADYPKHRHLPSLSPVAARQPDKLLVDSFVAFALYYHLADYIRHILA